MKPEQYAPVHPGDVTQAVQGLHGNYAARDIYDRYVEVARGNSRHPGHITAVGQILVRMGLPRRKVKGKTIYSIW